MPNPLEGVDQSNDPYIIVSSDTHAGLYVEDYRAYLESSVHAEFDEWLQTRHEHRAMVEEMNGEYVEQWERENEWGLKGAYDPEIRDKALDADGIAGEVIFADGDAVTLDASAFRAAIDQVEKAASSDDARPILTGVLMAAEEDGLRLVSTDSYRLSVRDLAGTTILGEGQKVLVPSRALKELSRVVGDADEITLRLGERDAGFEVGPVKVTTRLIEGDFPNYRGLIPSNHPNALTVDRETLLDAVRRVRLLAQESTPVRLAMSSEGLELVAVTQDVGQAHEAVEASYSGDELTVAFNPEYLIDGIEVAPGDEIILETVDELKPALLKSSDDPNFLYLLMPVRVS